MQVHHIDHSDSMTQRRIEIERTLLGMQKAEQTKSVDDYNTTLDYYIKVSQKYKEPINAGALDSAVILNIDRFNTVQDKKYQTLAKNMQILP